jgi:hypothetical protein
MENCGEVSAMRVYCEAGALHSRLTSLQREGRVTLVGFPYDPDSHTRKIKELASPSEAQIGDLDLPLGEMNFTFGEMVKSEKHSEIERIVGRNNRRDILQIDSAYKSHCACFFTRDKSDILAHRTELEALIGLRFFHPDDDWDRFLTFLNERQTPTSGGD